MKHAAFFCRTSQRKLLSAFGLGVAAGSLWFLFLIYAFGLGVAAGSWLAFLSTCAFSLCVAAAPFLIFSLHGVILSKRTCEKACEVVIKPALLRQDVAFSHKLICLKSHLHYSLFPQHGRILMRRLPARSVHVSFPSDAAEIPCEK
jgi:hypothetical protein